MRRALRGTRIRIALAALIAIGGAAGVMLLSVGASADGQEARVTSTDRWLPLAPSPLQRTEVGAPRIGRFIYVLGGFVPTPSGATTSEVTRYDIDANEWTKIRSMPVGVNHPAVAAYKAASTCTADTTGVVTQPIDRLFRYTPGPRPLALRPAMRVAREHIGAAAVDGKLYVIAGRAGGLNLDVVERYDPIRAAGRGCGRLRSRAAASRPRSSEAATRRSKGVDGEKVNASRYTVTAIVRHR